MSLLALLTVAFLLVIATRDAPMSTSADTDSICTGDEVAKDGTGGGLNEVVAAVVGETEGRIAEEGRGEGRVGP